MTFMSTYNRIAGQSLERLAALSDGVFAIAMTIIVLEIRLPAVEVTSEADLLRALGTLEPRMLTYLLSFLTLGIFWLGQQTQLHYLQQSDRVLSWIHFTFLSVICLLPFSTTLLSEYLAFRTALLLYWFNILLLGVILLWSWRYATRHGLHKPEAPADLTRTLERRILVAQALYALGAALCVFSTYLSVIVIIVVQVFAIVPRTRGPLNF
jgi:uncharacterized membrane protein